MTFNRIQLGIKLNLEQEQQSFSIVFLLLFSIYNMVGTTPVTFCGLSNSVFTVAI